MSLTNNQLSEKLCKLACKIDDMALGDYTDSERKRILTLIAAELHDISNEKFAPTSGTSWADIKPKNDTKKTYKSKSGQDLPF